MDDDRCDVIIKALFPGQRYDFPGFPGLGYFQDSINTILVSVHGPEWIHWQRSQPTEAFQSAYLLILLAIKTDHLHVQWPFKGR